MSSASESTIQALEFIVKPLPVGTAIPNATVRAPRLDWGQGLEGCGLTTAGRRMAFSSQDWGGGWGRHTQIGGWLAQLTVTGARRTRQTRRCWEQAEGRVRAVHGVG